MIDFRLDVKTRQLQGFNTGVECLFPELFKTELLKFHWTGRGNYNSVKKV